MEKRYQVFVSSTYEDLQSERQEVMQALLELDCIPSGMELFPAANDDQWTLIKKVIDDCDYYIVIIAGRYGSVNASGVSFTEMEYRYAIEQQKPIVAFLHKDPGQLSLNMTEKESEGKEKLHKFRELAQKKVVRFWSSPQELGSVVSRSVVRLMKTDPAIGWVRADNLSNEASAQEVLRLHKKIEELQSKVDQIKHEAPAGSSGLAQGEDSIGIGYSYDGDYHLGRVDSICILTWNEIFSIVSPDLINESDEERMMASLNKAITRKETSYIIQLRESSRNQNEEEEEDEYFGDLEIDENDFNTIKIQFRALGLIQKSQKNRSLKDTSNYWTLTDYGDTVMTQLRAIRKQAEAKALDSV